MRTTLLPLFFMLALSAFGQSDALRPDWTRNGRHWIRIRSLEDGIARLRADQLPGLPKDIDQRFLHLYWRGTEQRIYVQSNNASPGFDEDDFIEFIVRKNDGKLEALLYRDPVTGRPVPQLIPNDNFSQFDDTAAFFLTWNDVPRPDGLTFDNAEAAPLPEAVERRSFNETVRKDYAELYLTGGGSTYDGYFRYNCDYVTGEGYLSRWFYTTRTETLETPEADHDSGGEALFLCRIVGHSRLPQHKIRMSLDTTVREYTYPDISYQLCSLQTSLSAIRDGRANLSFTPLGGNSSTLDLNALCWLECHYPRLLNFERLSGRSISWNAAQSGPERLSFRLPPSTEDRLVVYDLDRRKRYVLQVSGGLAQPLDLESTPGERKLYLCQESVLNASLVDVSPIEFNLALIDEQTPSDFLILTHRQLQLSAEAYAAYRNSHLTRPLRTRIVYVEDLYDLYSYGSSHPGAIKEYMRFLFSRQETTPRFVFFWGQGRYAKAWGKNHTPTWGYPANDNEFVSRFDDETSNGAPLAAIGRVNARNNEDGFAYLRKVQEYESLPYAEWMHRTLHIGGGENESEQNRIADALGRHASVASAPPLAFDVYHYQKRNRPQPPTRPLPKLEDLIRGGVGVLQFFGHSDPTKLDVEIREPEYYDNKGRYFFMLANGCYSADFANSSINRTLGEKFVIADGIGAIGYLASSSVGYLFEMDRYTQALYELMFRDSVGLPIGLHLQRCNERFYDGQTLSRTFLNHLRQTHLQGDPALVLNFPAKPDLSFAPSALSVEPRDPGLQDSVFRFRLETRNFGQAIQDSFVVAVEHQAESSGIPPRRVFMGKYPAFLRSDTLSLRLALPAGSILSGLNKLTFILDSENEVDELSEDNNRWTFEWIAPGDRPTLIFPARYAVEGERDFFLTAIVAAKNQLEPTACQFEIDTSSSFSSVMLQQSGWLNLPAGRLHWKPDVSFSDSVVYFWRVRTAAMPENEWVSSSFQWIEGLRGWGQAHQNQLSELVLTDIEFNPTTGAWKGVGIPHRLAAAVWGSTYIKIDDGQIATTTDLLDNGSYNSFLFYSVISRKNLQPQTFTPNFGNAAPIYPDTDSTTLKEVIDQMEDGDLLLLLSKLPNLKGWHAANFDQIKRIGGSDSLRAFVDRNEQNIGMVVLGAKGKRDGPIYEMYRPNHSPSNGIRFDTVLYSPAEAGQASTLRIGPASRWGELSAVSRQISPESTSSVTVEGVKRDGTIDTLSLFKAFSIAESLQGINAADYPWLQLKWNPADSSDYLLPQLKRWHVLFDSPSELALSADDSTSAYRIKADESLSLGATSWLVRPLAPDSVWVRWTVRSPNHNVVHRDSLLIRNLADSVHLEVNWTASVEPGTYEIAVELNPGLRFPELYAYNNAFRRSVEVYVVPDTTQPRLEVWLDDRRAASMQTTTPNPRFLIQLSDDAGDAPLDQATLCRLYLTQQVVDRPGGAPVPAINYPGVFSFDFRYSEGNENAAFWRFEPAGLTAGVWEIRVQPFDQTGVELAEQDYVLRFQVNDWPSPGSWSLLPNPGQGRMRVVSPTFAASRPERATLEIVNVQGARAATIDLSAGMKEAPDHEASALPVDLTDLKAGVYFWRVIESPSRRNVASDSWQKLIWLGE